MLLPTPLLSLLSVASALAVVPPSPQHIFSSPSEQDEGYRIPSVHESAVMARRILHLSSVGSLVTTFPASHNDLSTSENRPHSVEHNPIGLMEYYADCEPNTGNPTLLGINIATPYRNYEAGSNISLGVRWWPAQTNSYAYSFFRSGSDEEIPTPHTPAALPRFSLHGHLELVSSSDLKHHNIASCFLKTHPDSKLWQPGNDIHESDYMRFVVEHVYWFGGFGDRARIGWLPVEEWRNVTREETERMKLPGEHWDDRPKWWKQWL